MHLPKLVIQSVMTFCVCLLSTTAAIAHDLHYYVVENIASPFQITDAENSDQGVITDIVLELADTLNLDLEIPVTPSPRIGKLLEGKDKKMETGLLTIALLGIPYRTASCSANRC